MFWKRLCKLQGHKCYYKKKKKKKKNERSKGSEIAPLLLVGGGGGSGRWPRSRFFFKYFYNMLNTTKTYACVFCISGGSFGQKINK